MTHEGKELFTAEIPPEFLSRGTGEQVSLHEATTLDFMPQLIGSQFQEVDGLRRTVHFRGEASGPFMTLQQAYKQLASDELERDNLVEALDAYKKALYNTTSFIGAIAMLGDGALLNTGEMDRMDLAGQFGELEGRLTVKIWAGKVAFHPDEYAQFVRDVRQREKRALQLNQLFFFGRSGAFETLEAPQKEDSSIGREYIDLCVAMNNYTDAAWIAGKLGLDEEVARYKALAESEGPKDNPYLDELIERHMPTSRFGGGDYY